MSTALLPHVSISNVWKAGGVHLSNTCLECLFPLHLSPHSTLWNPCLLESLSLDRSSVGRREKERDWQLIWNQNEMKKRERISVAFALCVLSIEHFKLIPWEERREPMLSTLRNSHGAQPIVRRGYELGYYELGSLWNWDVLPLLELFYNFVKM